MNAHTPKHHKHAHGKNHRAALTPPVAPQPHHPNILEGIGNGINNAGSQFSDLITRAVEGAGRAVAGAGGAAYNALKSGIGGGDHEATPRVAEQSPAVAPIPYDARAASPSDAGIRSIDTQPNAQPKRIPILAEKQEVVETRTGKRNKNNKKTPVTETIDLHF